MENIIIEGIITTTSNKQSDKFESKNPRKTAYIKCDDENSQKLEFFGLQKYTSEKDKEDFFCVKITNELKMYLDAENPPVPLETSVTTDNFKTEKPIYMNIIKGENLGNTFYRLSSVLLDNSSDIVMIEPENPFA